MQDSTMLKQMTTMAVESLLSPNIDSSPMVPIMDKFNKQMKSRNITPILMDKNRPMVWSIVEGLLHEMKIPLDVIPILKGYFPEDLDYGKILVFITNVRGFSKSQRIQQIQTMDAGTMKSLINAPITITVLNALLDSAECGMPSITGLIDIVNKTHLNKSPH